MANWKTTRMILVVTAEACGEIFPLRMLIGLKEER